MADAGIWIKNANIQARCGIGANATAKAVAATDVYVLDVENFISAYVGTKITAAVYAALDVNVKYLLMDVGANICAMYVIQWDMDGYGSTAKAQTMLDILRDRIEKGLELLKDKNVQKMMGVI